MGVVSVAARIPEHLHNPGTSLSDAVRNAKSHSRLQCAFQTRSAGDRASDSTENLLRPHGRIREVIQGIARNIRLMSASPC
jgi:hypothetical protein